MNGRRRDDTLGPAETLLARATGQGRVEREQLLRRAMEYVLPLSVSIARQYRARGEPDDDLQQVAALAVVKAVRRYVPREGVSLAAFAVPTIHGELKRHFRDNTWMLRPPRRLQELRIAAQAARAELTQRLGRPPERAELAAHLEVDEAQLRELEVAAGGYRPEPLEVDVVDGAGRCEPERPPEAEFLLDLDAALPALDALPALHRRVVALHYFGGLSQRQVAAEIGVSQVQVSRLLATALSSVRSELT